MKKLQYILITLVALLGTTLIVSAAPPYSIFRSLLPETTNTYDIGSSTRVWANGYFGTLYGDGSNLTGITGGGATTTINGIIGPTFIFNTLGTNGLSYSSSTGILTITQATSTGSQAGFLTSTDWQTFNNKSSQLWGLSGSNLSASSTSWNVGIGTTTPSQTLTVNGGLFVGTSTVGIPTLYVASTTGRVGIGTSTPSSLLDVAGTVQLRGFATSTTGLYVDGSGNVGIGTASPLSKTDIVLNGSPEAGVVAGSVLTNLSLYNTGGTYIAGRDTTNNIEFAFGTSVTGGTFAGSMTAHDFQLRTDNATRMIILKTTGNVGIGTPTPVYKLTILGDLFVNTSSTLGNVISGNWLGSAIADGYISSAATWNAKQVGSGELTALAAIATSTGSLIVGQGNTTGWAALTVGTNGKVLMASSTATGGVSWEAVAGVGTVTSVDMSVPTGLTITGNPITAAGTLALTLTNGYEITKTASSSLWEATRLTVNASSTVWNTVTEKQTTITFPIPVASTSLAAGRSLTLTTNTIDADAELYDASINLTLLNATTTTASTTVRRYIPLAMTISKITCNSSQAYTIQFDIRDSATPNTAGSGVLSAGLACSTTATASSTTFADATVPADSWLNLIATSTSGTTDNVQIGIVGSLDD